MKFYRITFNDYDYDMYDSFIVCAENEDKVVKLVKKEHGEPDPWNDVDWKSGYKVEELKADKEEIILGSFNAG